MASLMSCPKTRLKGMPYGSCNFSNLREYALLLRIDVIFCNHILHGFLKFKVLREMPFG